ncbi:transposase, partial [Paraliomyxa miuraensis]|uniref:transposase n=2 Tax=Paraliomyxa miuraensis TaxID=376150 RepID=UPI00224DF570
NGDRYAKHEFAINLEGGTVRCPAGETTRFHGTVARFEASTCEQCSHRERCTTAKHGRSISIHPQEQLLQKLAAAKATPEGRAELRKRVPVEHGLAHICQRQGRRARYLGVDKNIFDLTRYAVIENLFVADRMERALAA